MIEWSDKELRKLSVSDLENLADNATRVGNNELASRCQQRRNTLARIQELDRRHPRLYELLFSRVDVITEEVLLAWTTERLNTAIQYVKERQALGSESHRGGLLKKLKRAVQQKRADKRPRGGQPVLQGGRADGNKPNKRK